MSVVSLAELRALVDTDLEETDLQGVIDRASARLAAAIGPLAGERTQVLLLATNQTRERLTLQRTTDAVEVTDNGVDVDAADVRLLADGRTLLRLSSDGYANGYWTGPVEVTYEPTDLEQVRDGIISMVAFRLGSLSGGISSGDIVSETTMTYSYTRARSASASMTPEQHERTIIASLLPKQLPSSIRLRSSIVRRPSPLLGTVRPA